MVAPPNACKDVVRFLKGHCFLCRGWNLISCPDATLVLRFTETFTNNIDGFVSWFRRKPQR
jgi:hypothetical protein